MFKKSAFNRVVGIEQRPRKPSLFFTFNSSASLSGHRCMSELAQRKSLFWEIDPSRIEQVLETSHEWVVVRVFEYGEIEDIWEVIRLYGKERVAQVLSNADLKPVASVMAYLFLGIDRYHKYDA
jgi:hypothetical protein